MVQHMNIEVEKMSMMSSIFSPDCEQTLEHKLNEKSVKENQSKTSLG